MEEDGLAEGLAGGTAVVTGAAGGIGLGIARAAADAGMSLVIADIAADRLAAVEKEFLDRGIETLAIVTNTADPAAVDRLAHQAIERFGAPRLLVNNAGVEMMGDIWELPAEQWQRIMDINVLGPVHGVRAFVPAMIAARTPAYIANITSIGGLGMSGGQAPYIVSKHALLSFTECLFLELAEAAPHIKVSAVLPGPVATRIFTDAVALTEQAHIAKAHDQMEAVLAQGMSGDDAGRAIVDQIVEGRFWVSPHPEMMEGAAQSRAAYLAGLHTPAQRVRPSYDSKK
ncbi:SDR family NAD(P)-dependent oxidoreductase [Sphingomonas montanisoli]|uniref:SDR family NAD(P)-dependent oxidoreductase n=1 Tax=Sphingomonas montanisoli TaxID=2606412 RepID=A0A5D9C274_9SPHN|nr:SDR family NAD(P)-dependent oxidoreductase [Sphingomonas montanisoli]